MLTIKSHCLPGRFALLLFPPLAFNREVERVIVFLPLKVIHLEAAAELPAVHEDGAERKLA